MILFLEPYFEKKPWAGDKLKTIYDCPEGTGEAWIVSGYARKSSRVKEGKYKGETLRHLWTTHPELFGNFTDKEFPLLIKIIDAKEDLSVQVHPNDAYALKRHNSLGKFECWYFLNQNEAKTCVAGINATKQLDVKNYLDSGILPEKLIKRDVHLGDLVVIEPGTVHALKAGSLVLEVQESSDITYRLYDYTRGRQLHIEDSLNVICYNDNRNPIYPFQRTETFDSKYFSMHKIFIDGNVTYHTNSFIIGYVLDGTMVINQTTVRKGETLIITAGENEIKCSGIGRGLVIIPKEKEETRPKMRKVALITGIVSQDGSYLAELLLNKGYEVHGLITSKSQLKNERIEKLVNDSNIYNNNLFFHIGDLTDTSSLNRLLENVKPDEIYNLASQSHVDLSFEIPEYTAQVNALGTLRILDAIKQNELKTRLFNESSSQIFGDNVNLEGVQDETTALAPENPYATSKAYAHFIVQNYRKNYGIYAVNGILYNHSSPREDDDFVFKKVTSFVGQYAGRNSKKLYVGNIDSKRDWGFAPDYVEGMWLSLQQNNPEDYVFATGQTHTVKELIELSFLQIGIKIKWQGEGLNIKGINEVTGDTIVEIDPSLYRFSDTSLCKGCPNKAISKLGWNPKTQFNELIELMVKNGIRSRKK